MNEVRRLLSDLHSQVSTAREDVRPQWKDVVAEDFELRFWKGIDQAARECLKACDAFEEVLSRAEGTVYRLE